MGFTRDRTPGAATFYHVMRKLDMYAFLMADNFAKRLKTLQGLTPYEYIGQCWQKEPERFTMIRTITPWD